MAATVQNPTRPGIYYVARNDKGQAVHQTPEGINPGMVKGDSSEAKYTRQVFTSNSQLLAECNALYIRHDNRLGERLRSYRPGELDSAKRDTLALAKSHEDALKEKANFKMDPAMATAIVGIFSNMPVHEHAQAVTRLIEEGDGPILAALDKISPVLTKCPPEVRGTIRDRLFEKADPMAFAAMKEAEANVRAIDRAMNVMVSDLAKFATPTDVAAEVHSVASGVAA